MGNKDVSKLSDEILLQGVVENDERLITELYNRKIPMMVRYLKKWGKSDEKSMDLAHDAFIRILKHSHQYKAIASVNTWIITIVRNRMYTEYRDNKLFNSHLSIDIDPDTLNCRPIELSTVDPDVHTAKVIRSGIERHMKLMCSEYREVMLLRIQHDMSYKDISKKLGIPEGTVRSRLNRGRKYMKDHLSHLLN